MRELMPQELSRVSLIVFALSLLALAYVYFTEGDQLIIATLCGAGFGYSLFSFFIVTIFVAFDFD